MASVIAVDHLREAVRLQGCVLVAYKAALTHISESASLDGAIANQTLTDNEPVLIHAMHEATRSFE